jgi:DNA primase
MSEYLDLSERVVSDIRSASDIVEVIGEYTTLKKGGKSWKGLCPFHKERTPSFSVSPDRGLFYCFGCGAAGDIFHFVQQIERIDFPAAAESLARKFGVEIPRKGRREGTDRFELMRSALARAQELYSAKLWAEDNRAREYLAERGVSEETARSLGLGFAPNSWDFLSGALASAFSADLLVEAGLLQPGQEGKRPYDRFRHRLLFPIRDERGGVVGFGGRSLSGEEPKYLNSPESPIFQKSRLLYGLASARESMRARERAVLVEGYFDHLACVLSGVGECVASMGTALARGQAERLRRVVARAVVCYDGDAAGKNATRRAIPLLLAAGLEVGVARMPAGIDPFDLYRESGPEAVLRAVDSAFHFLDWMLEEAGPSEAGLSAEEKRRRIAAIVETLESVPDQVLRYEYTRKVAGATAVPHELLWKPKHATAPAGPGTNLTEKPLKLAVVPDAERRFLLGVLNGADGFEEALGSLSPEDFEDSRARTIFSAIRNANKGDSAIDFSSLATHLKGEGEIALLSELSVVEVSTADRGDINIVLNGLQKRSLDRQIEAIQRQIEAAAGSGSQEEIDKLLRSKTSLTRRIHDLAREGTRRKDT